MGYLHSAGTRGQVKDGWCLHPTPLQRAGPATGSRAARHGPEVFLPWGPPERPAQAQLRRKQDPREIPMGKGTEQTEPCAAEDLLVRRRETEMR